MNCPPSPKKNLIKKLNAIEQDRLKNSPRKLDDQTLSPKKEELDQGN